MKLHRIAYIENPFSEFRLSEIPRAASEDNHFFAHLGLHLTLLHGLVPNSLVPFASGTLLTPAWSLSLEWQFYLVAPLLVAALTGQNRVLRWSIALALTAAAALLARQAAFTWSYSSFLLQVSGYFVVGVLCRQALECKRKGKQTGELLALAALVAVFLDPLAIAIWAGWSLIVLVETDIITIRNPILSKAINIFAFSRFAGQAGTWSFSTYLVHFPIYSIAVGSYGLSVGARPCGRILFRRKFPISKLNPF
jgi:peptidoglycan/LPS O-acetylase OafA/YrhL